MARKRMLAPINSNKHYVHQTNTVVGTGLVLNLTAVDAVVAPATSNSFDVEEGSVVKAIHLEYWINGNHSSADVTQFGIAVLKVPGGSVSPTFTNMNNLGAYENKKNILFTSQGIIAAQVGDSQSVPILRDWILIPKGKQRMGLGDRIITVLACSGQPLRVCGLATYKEYR